MNYYFKDPDMPVYVRIEIDQSRILRLKSYPNRSTLEIISGKEYTGILNVYHAHKHNPEHIEQITRAEFFRVYEKIMEQQIKDYEEFKEMVLDDGR